MSLYVYDGSFEGMLSVIFECFADKSAPTDIVSEHTYQASLLAQVREIKTDPAKAERVLAGVDARSAGKGAALVYQLFLSELPGIELHIYRFIHLLVQHNNPDILENFANEQVLYTAQVIKMIGREVHRMHAFVRFQKTSANIYFAVITPDFNVLPLLGDHFMRRYADQAWVIFDTQRGYGLHYDLTDMNFIDQLSPVVANITESPGAVDNEEDNYQKLWQQYFQSVNIGARKNTKLHLRHLPRRYWKYLTEKQVFAPPLR